VNSELAATTALLSAFADINGVRRRWGGRAGDAEDRRTPIACAITAAAQAPVVREGGLRAVVAAISIARNHRRRPDTHPHLPQVDPPL